MKDATGGRETLFLDKLQATTVNAITVVQQPQVHDHDMRPEAASNILGSL
jgi:hypothetical protein